MNRTKKLYMGITASILAAAVTVGFVNLATAAVAFNIFPISYTPALNRDLPLLDARNVTQNIGFSTSQADHDNGVPANPGDVIEFQIYYHNGGVSDDIAHNVVVQAVLQSGARQSHNISATIDSDETSPISSVDHGGNMTVNISGSTPQTLQFISGSTRHFPNRASQIIIPPNGDNVVGSGLNIGNIRGCFEFSGFVNFRARVGSAVPADRDLTILKQVQNITQGTGFQSFVNANPGDRVKFKITINTTGNASQNNIRVRDTISDTSRVTFVSGTLRVDDIPNSLEADFFGSQGLNLGTLNAGITKTITFEANVAGSGSFPPGTPVTITNAGFVRSDQIAEKRAQAEVRVSVPSGERNLTIQKRVMNITRGDSGFQDSVSANPGDRVKFEIRFQTTGTAGQTNIVLRDSLPDRLTFVSNSLWRSDQGSVSGDQGLFGSGINFGNLPFGNERTLTFEANVAGSGSFSGNTTLANAAFIRSNEISERSASAVVNVNVPGESRTLNITKRVLNLTRGDSNFQDSITANPGDRVKFEIRVDIGGNIHQTGVIVRDILPSQLTYAAGTLRQDGSTVANEYEIFGSGRNIGAQSAGTTRVFTFEATIAGSSSFSGSTTLTNTANVRSDQVGTRQDDATIMVQVGAAQFTLRKTAFNLTKGVDATVTPADPGDIITYTLYYKNTGGVTLFNVVIEDNIQDVLELAEIANQGGALSVDSMIRYAPVEIQPGVEIARTFQVRVRHQSLFPASSDLFMVNVYGNEVRVQVRRPTIGGVAAPPRTGPEDFVYVVLAAAATGAYWVYRRKKSSVLS